MRTPTTGQRGIVSPVDRDRRSTARCALWALLVALPILFLAAGCRMDPHDDVKPDDSDDAARAAPRQVRIGDIEWYAEYRAAVEVARREDKPLWVHFGENPG